MSTIVEKDKDKRMLGNATKFGLAGIGVALTMLGFAFADVISLNAVVLATVLTMGFAAPFLAGILEYAKGNSFRATSFIMFSLFFLTYFIFSTRALNGVAAGKSTLGIYYLVWTLVIAAMECGTIMRKMDIKKWMLSIILCTFMLFTLFLAIAQFAQVKALFITAGVFALICALTIFVDFAYHIYRRMEKDM